MTIPFIHVAFVAGIIFLMGMICMITHRNLIMMLLGIEIMLNASAIVFVGASLHAGNLDGQSMAIFILAVAATEVAIGLALIVCIYRQTQTISPMCIEEDTCRL